MGLLDSVLGAVLNNGQQQAQPQGGLGGLGGGLGGIIGMLASNPQLIQVVTGMLSNNGDHRDLHGGIHSFPTRRSSDLLACQGGRVCMVVFGGVCELSRI